MEVHPRVNSVLAKRLWNVLRVTFFMIRKGLGSKRKLIMDMNLMMKRGKLLRKSLSNLMSLHHHHHHHSRDLAREEAQLEAEESSRAVVTVPKTPEYTFNLHFDHASEFAPGEKRSPLLSPFSVRVSDYSSEDENDGGNVQVDDEAEEFIRRFYEQLRVQSRMHLLQYQEP
uniref:DUF761 domain-containing protein n=1 Tax=Salix viminalis TaxID=40686 RepID=A0A6N2M9U7_SALVM